MGAKRIAKHLILERDQQVVKWLENGETFATIHELHQKEYGVGVSPSTVGALRRLNKTTLEDHPPKRQVPRDQIPARNKQVIKWLGQGHTISECQDFHRKEYGCGIAFETVASLRDTGTTKRKPKAKRPPPEPEEAHGLVLASPTGLVPARDVSDRLRALIAHVADAMGREGVCEVMIQEREVVVSFTPDQQLFEV